MAENGTSTATRRRTSGSSNGSGPKRARGSGKGAGASKGAAKSAAKAPSKVAEKVTPDGGVSEAAKLTAVAGGSALLGAAGGFAGANATGSRSSGRKTVAVPKFKTSTSIKLIAGAAKLGYHFGRTRERFAQR